MTAKSLLLALVVAAVTWSLTGCSGSGKSTVPEPTAPTFKPPVGYESKIKQPP
jgi:hypothetical protein